MDSWLKAVYAKNINEFCENCFLDISRTKSLNFWSIFHSLVFFYNDAAVVRNHINRFIMHETELSRSCFERLMDIWIVSITCQNIKKNVDELLCNMAEKWADLGISSYNRIDCNYGNISQKSQFCWHIFLRFSPLLCNTEKSLDIHTWLSHRHSVYKFMTVLNK